jgi:hypothetical protein
MNIEQLEQETGLKAGEDFGFIAGTRAPFNDGKGMMSASMREGYTVWMYYDKPKRKSVQIQIDEPDPVKEYEKVKQFLTQPRTAI